MKTYRYLLSPPAKYFLALKCTQRRRLNRGDEPTNNSTPSGLVCYVFNSYNNATPSGFPSPLSHASKEFQVQPRRGFIIIANEFNPANPEGVVLL